MTAESQVDSTSSPLVPLCALGASAGGLAALKIFFSHVRNDLGLAYIVVVHLAPEHPSALSEILAAQTTMSVMQIEDTVELRPNCVYVIPPNRELVVEGDNVIARSFRGSKGRHSPIDMLFQSIAAGRSHGIAVLLSGSGSDGTVGARAVKEAGGVIFAQDPTEAEYEMMPESAIATGVVDFVAPVADLTERIAEVARSKIALREESAEDVEQQIRQIIALLRRRTGHDFSSYKRPTIMRRLSRRMQVVRQESFANYYQFLQNHKDEVSDLFSELLISVTSFFRDPEAFAVVSEKVIKPLFDRLDDEASIRAWVIGCATGEEAYSLAILLLEEAARRCAHPTIQIFASDIDDLALTMAREGRYPRSIEADVSEERLRRFFIQDDAHYRVKKELRDLILFAEHSALKDPPFIKLDLISCRNLLIYLQRELQRQLCGLFHYALNPHGYIFLGSAETIDANQGLFVPVDRDARIYAATGSAARVAPNLAQLTSDFRSIEHRPIQSAQTESTISVGHAHAAALESSAPPSVLVDGSLKILHLSPSAGNFFRPLEGPFSVELPDQVRPELRVDLKLALQRAFEKGETSLSVPIPVAFNGAAHLVALHVRPSKSGDHQTTTDKALVFFVDLGVAPPVEETPKIEKGDRGEVKRLRQELTAAQDRLSASRKEHEQATQDLRAANEELQSINEEYRSTAEELETSKEELQSINEELQTVNSELKHKLEAISTAHNDLENLVEATEIGTLFLDPDFKIRFFTPKIRDYFNIGAPDIGRVLSDFRYRLVYDDLEQDVGNVLRTLIPINKVVKTTDERSLSIQIRPYRTQDNQIQGVVVTFTDITKLKLAEERLSAELLAMELLQALSTKVMESSQIEQPLENILDAIIKLIDADCGSIQLYDETNQVLRLIAHRGFEKSSVAHYSTVNVSFGDAYGVDLAKCERVAFDDIEKQPAFAPNLNEARAAGYRAIVSAPLCSIAGKLVGLLAVHFREPHHFTEDELRLVDICARRAADAISVHLLQQQLKDADRRKDEFLAMLAHELRNPLTPIQNALNVLKDRRLPAEDVERLYSVIQRQESHLIRLVDDLLDIARITRGKIELRRNPMDLREAIRQAVESNMSQLEAKAQKIAVLLPETALTVDGDFVRLSQVFSNLIHNSSKFTQSEGHIDVSAEREGDDASVIVRDNGRGFSKNSLTLAFELFNQGDEIAGGGQGGIGVGLALARGLVELHGGTIAAFSEGLGKGSEIRVRLPLTLTGSVVAPQPTPESSSHVAVGRVLIVDDQQDVAESLAMLIRSFDIEVKTAPDGTSALETLAAFSPDLVITDIGLPGMDGFELATQVRKLAQGKNIVLVALSGWGQEEVRQRAVKAGFDHFFVKPIDIKNLESLLLSSPPQPSN